MNMETALCFGAFKKTILFQLIPYGPFCRSQYFNVTVILEQWRTYGVAWKKAENIAKLNEVS